MDISIAANPARRAAYLNAQMDAVQNAKQAKAAASARVQDETAISAQARGAINAEAASEDNGVASATTFPAFADEFAAITQGYTDAVKAHYADAHAENLTYDDPAKHIWDKYKNPESPDFRSDLSDDERAWAYDQELDMLSGGRHLQLRNPYAFPGEEALPSLDSTAAQAYQSCREQIGSSIQSLLAENGVELPEDASFRLSVSPSDYTIRVSGLDDDELTEAVEQALNRGSNGKNLYDYLKLTAPAENGALSVGYESGGLTSPVSEKDLDERTVKQQAGPVWARYSETYDPHQESMNETVLCLDPNSPLNTPESKDRMSAAVRVGAPELIAEFRARQSSLSLAVNQNREVDPDGSISAKTYMDAYAQQYANTRAAIQSYYAGAHAENSAYPLAEGLNHIAEKYLRSDSAIFRSDLSDAERSMAYRQEYALLTGGRLSLNDPYALASIGGVPSEQSIHEIAMQAVQTKLDQLWSAR